MKGMIIGLAAMALMLVTGGNVMADAQDPVIVRESSEIKASPAELQGIVTAIEYYINATRKGDSKIAWEGFAPAATMSWSDGKSLVSVPIEELYKFFDEKPRQSSCELVSCNVAGDVAIARIESRADDAKFTDMFTLVKDGDKWKIVSKVYHTRK